ncbi:TPA: phage tail protein, partial [Citrobacter farmeri]|nr:phage tail protein [Citrobacter farmeri]
MKHSDIRQAIIDVLEGAIGHDAIYFDGRPVAFEENEFPAVAVFLTDAEPTDAVLDANEWQATLHIEVFLPAQVPDSELDEWMESRVYPAMADIPALEGIV